MTETIPPLLYLPVLHEELCDVEIKTAVYAKYIGVGLAPDLSVPTEEGAVSHWTPPNYPFSHSEARVCLHDIKAMGEAALSGVPLQALMNMQTPHAEFKRLEEQRALENFMREGQATQEQTNESKAENLEQNVHMLRTAQKFLLWAWLMEEYIVELQDLSQKYSVNSTHILDALGVEDNPALLDLLHIQGSLADADFVLPPWRLVLENMAPFLPNECTVIINSAEMAEHILQIADVTPLSAEQQQALHINTTAKLCQCFLTVEQLLKDESQRDKNTHGAPFGHTKKLHCILLQHEVA